MVGEKRGLALPCVELVVLETGGLVELGRANCGVLVGEGGLLCKLGVLTGALESEALVGKSGLLGVTGICEHSLLLVLVGGEVGLLLELGLLEGAVGGDGLVGETGLE